VNIDGEKVIVERLKRSGYEVLKVPMPALIAMDSEVELRLPSLKDIKEANKKPITTWIASDLAIDIHRLEKRRVHQLFQPPSRKRQCFMIEGQTLQEKGENLALKLRQDKVI
jgi:electron transfer flavoprotein alpha/beta subunit